MFNIPAKLEEMESLLRQSQTYNELIALRQDLIMNIQLADNKALGLVQTFPTLFMKELYLKVVEPTLDTSDAPEGYEIFNATKLSHIRYQCSILIEILENKYSIINQMVWEGRREIGMK